MEQQEKRLVKLNPQIIERFENDEEMLMIKGGVGPLAWLLALLSGEIHVFNCGDCKCQPGCVINNC